MGTSDQSRMNKIHLLSMLLSRESDVTWHRTDLGIPKIGPQTYYSNKLHGYGALFHRKHINEIDNSTKHNNALELLCTSCSFLGCK